MATGNEEAKLFVAGLPDSVSEDVLRQIFEAAGVTVLSVSLPKDRMTGRPRGFGFVTLASADEAQSARETLDGSVQGGRSISVRPFQSEPPRKGEGGPPGPVLGAPRIPAPRSNGPPTQTPDRTLYIGNLPYDCTQQEVEQLIVAAAGEGQIARVHLPTDPEGRKRGFGFVTMASADAAKTAAEQLKTADIRGRKLIVNIAHPKADRPARPDGSFGGGGAPFPSAGGGGGGAAFPGGGGFPNPAFGPPATRKTFDSERRRKHGGGPVEGEAAPAKRGAGGGGGRGRRDRTQDDDFDWRGGGSDDE